MRHIVSRNFKNIALATLLSLACFSPLASASAAGEGANYELPLNLAIEAARQGVKTCEANGYQVTVTIVDKSGVIKVQAKGDGSAIHTKDSSYGKAYTIASMGRVFNIDTTSQFAKKLNALRVTKPELSAVGDIAGILPLPGGVAIRAYGEIIGGIGIGGAPGGDKDEVCAQAALSRIHDHLPK